MNPPVVYIFITKAEQTLLVLSLYHLLPVTPQKRAPLKGVLKRAGFFIMPLLRDKFPHEMIFMHFVQYPLEG
jgi:hypothetical protein